MRVICAISLVILCGLCAFNPNAEAAGFDLLFRIAQVSGKCSVLAPGATEFQEAEVGRAYPYGSKVQTGAKGASTIRFGSLNECRLAEGTIATIAEDAANPRIKMVQLEHGAVEVLLDEAYAETNELRVETPLASCSGSTSYTVDLKRDGRILASDIVCSINELAVTSSDFSIPALEQDEHVALVGGIDRTFLRVSNVRGGFVLNVADGLGGTRQHETEAGSVLKVWQKPAPHGSRSVSTLFIDPRGTLLDGVTYSVDAEGALLGNADEENVVALPQWLDDM